MDEKAKAANFLERAIEATEPEGTVQNIVAALEIIIPNTMDTEDECKKTLEQFKAALERGLKKRRG